MARKADDEPKARIIIKHSRYLTMSGKPTLADLEEFTREARRLGMADAAMASYEVDYDRLDGMSSIHNPPRSLQISAGKEIKEIQ